MCDAAPRVAVSRSDGVRESVVIERVVERHDERNDGEHDDRQRHAVPGDGRHAQLFHQKHSYGAHQDGPQVPEDEPHEGRQQQIRDVPLEQAGEAVEYIGEDVEEACDHEQPRRHHRRGRQLAVAQHVVDETEQRRRFCRLADAAEAAHQRRDGQLHGGTECVCDLGSVRVEFTFVEISATCVGQWLHVLCYGVRRDITSRILVT